MHKSFVKTFFSLSFLFLVISKASAEGIWFPTDKPSCEVWNPQPQSEETALWSGACLNGKAHGKGVTTWRNKKDGKFVLRLIEGERKNGRVIGQLTVTYENGDVYIGKLNTNGNRDGQGTYVWLDGTKFEGGYKDGKYHGQGTFTLSHGEIQKGLWKDGKLAESDGGYGRKGYNFGFKTKWVKDKYAGIDFELRNCAGSYFNPFSNLLWSKCHGSHTFGANSENEGDIYVGEFEDGKSHGQGTIIYASGNKYVGEFEVGKKHGQGTFTFSLGSKFFGNKYVGSWKNNKQHGQGTFTHSNGDTYVGDNKDGKRNGQGTYTLANGGKYVGEFKDGNYHGQGTFTFANGIKWVGKFENNKLNGYTIQYNADGSINQEGIFKDGIFVE